MSFFSIFCSNHSGTLFSLGVSVGMFMAQIRFVACLIILALSAGAKDINGTDNASASQNRRDKVMAQESNLLAQENTSSSNADVCNLFCDELGKECIQLSGKWCGMLSTVCTQICEPIKTRICEM